VNGKTVGLLPDNSVGSAQPAYRHARALANSGKTQPFRLNRSAVRNLVALVVRAPHELERIDQAWLTTLPGSMS
jgi:hypothetical protein